MAHFNRAHRPPVRIFDSKPLNDESFGRITSVMVETCNLRRLHIEGTCNLQITILAIYNSHSWLKWLSEKELL